LKQGFNATNCLGVQSTALFNEFKAAKRHFELLTD
jgi:hypothetical protein